MNDFLYSIFPIVAIALLILHVWLYIGRLETRIDALEKINFMDANVDLLDPIAPVTLPLQKTRPAPPKD